MGRLPRSDVEYDWEPTDQYEWLWDRLSTWLADIDDAPAWERDVKLPCSRCDEREVLDPRGTCSRCRVDDGRCAWCGLDPTVYSSNGACRTCYQRLRRAGVTNTGEQRIVLLEAAFRRSELRKRRQGPL